jgi:hypothetical protein
VAVVAKAVVERVYDLIESLITAIVGAGDAVVDGRGRTGLAPIKGRAGFGTVAKLKVVALGVVRLKLTAHLSADVVGAKHGVLAEGVVQGVEHLVGLLIARIDGARHAVVNDGDVGGDATRLGVTGFDSVAVKTVVASLIGSLKSATDFGAQVDGAQDGILAGRIVRRMNHLAQRFVAGIHGAWDAVVDRRSQAWEASLGGIAALLTVAVDPVAAVDPRSGDADAALAKIRGGAHVGVVASHTILDRLVDAISRLRNTHSLLAGLLTLLA